MIKNFGKRIVVFFDMIFNFHIHHDFVWLFLNKEGRILLGRNYNSLWIFVILTITFVVIGFANGSIDYLKKKMKEPFVNYLSIDVPSDKDDNAGKIQFELNQNKVLKDSFNYTNVSCFNPISLNFYKINKEGKRNSFPGRGRTISMTDPVYKELIGSDFLIKGRGFKDEKDMGLIVTKNFLEDKLNHPPNALHIKGVVGVGSNDTVAPIPIVAVVKKLPGLREFVATEYFRRNDFKEGHPFNPLKADYKDDLMFFTVEDSNKVLDIKKNILEIISKKKYADYDPVFEMLKDKSTYKDGFVIQINFYPVPESDIKTSIVNDIVNNENLKDIVYQVFKPKCPNLRENDRFDYMSIKFNNTDSASSFQNYMSDKYGLNIDIAQIKAWENYNFIAKITWILSLILVLFSVLIICMFISNVLSKHLEKIQMNIGTFKAFGISKQVLMKIYIVMIYCYLSVALIISLIISWVFGSIKGVRGILLVFNLKLEKGQSYFNLFDWWTLIAIIIIMLNILIVLYWSANKIFKKSPGDLIYNRE